MAEAQSRFVFPRWANFTLPFLVIFVLGGSIYVPVLFGFGASPVTKDAGYAPVQPVPYSHALHVGQLGLDCRYCHTGVEKVAFANIPATQTCMNCHTNIRTDSPKLEPIRNSWATGKPVEWVKVHDLPDFVYFNHSAHVNHGVGCVTCHGQIDRMDVVRQVAPLSMGWCLECHRAPEKFLRPKDQVTNLHWKPEIQGNETLAEAQLRVGLKLKDQYHIHDKHYMQSCSTCHR
jgi:hypothetical protein